MLTPKEELTLMQYNDGELGLLGRLCVKGLLARQESKLFLDGLRRLRVDILNDAKAKDGAGHMSGSLWDRVEARIDQEERAALYLGRRRFSQSDSGSWRGAWQFASGAVAAAVLLFLVVGPRTDGKFRIRSVEGGASLSTREVSGVRPVSLGESPVRRAVRPLQVEWMKSAGRVNFIESDDHDDLAIMWISKERIPSIGAETFTAPLSRASRNTPVLINERLPRDVPVFAPKEEP